MPNLKPGPSDTYRELNRALQRAGLTKCAVKQTKGVEFAIDGPVNILVNTPIDASPYAKILLEFATQLTDPKEIEMVARCMSQSKGFSVALPWLLSLFDGFPQNGLSTPHLWAVGNAIYTINDKRSYSAIISVCQQKKFATARQMLMGSLARSKTDAAYQVLLKCLDDPTVRAHAIEGLGRFGRTDAIPILERVVAKKGLYEYKAKKTALRRLERKLSK